MGLTTITKQLSGEKAAALWRAAASHMSKYNFGLEDAADTFRGYASD